MAHDIRELEKEDFPRLLFEIPDCPERLRIRGKLPKNEPKFLCVVGSRRYTNYGRDVCEKLITGLKGKNIVIVSGLALGIDALAHKTALRAGLKTVGIPGSGLDPSIIYPRTNRVLSEKIINSGGALISEFEDKFKATPQSFPRRNRIMAGMSDAVLIIEAEPRSGTLITARLGLEYNREVFVVPGSILSRNSLGTNALIKDGAIPINSSEDLLEELGLQENRETLNLNFLSEEERRIIEILKTPMSRDELIKRLDLGISQSNLLISAMEIKGLIRENLGILRID